MFEPQAITWILCTNPLLSERVPHAEQLNPASVAMAGTKIHME